jgi:hypothetical protein
MDTLDIPDFLRRERTGQPVQLLIANTAPRRKRWRKRPIHRPEGETWATAELVNVFLLDEAAPIGSGQRLVWVREGRKWCKLCSLDGTKAKISMAAWGIIARRAAR